MGTISYDKDVVLWAQEQARLLRSGQFSELDLEHLADEIEDVGRSEKRELASRVTVLLAHLLKWKHQPALRGKSWLSTIEVQRKRIFNAIEETPSLKTIMREPKWQEGVWLDATLYASRETGRDREEFGATCPWSQEQILDLHFLPE